MKLVVNKDKAVAYRCIFDKEEIGIIAIKLIFEEDRYRIECFRVREKMRESSIGKKLFRKKN